LRQCSCIFCLKRIKWSESNTVFIDSGSIKMCDDCFRKASEKGLVSDLGHIENKDFYAVVKDLHRFAILIEYYEVFEVLSRLDESSRDFLNEVYGRRTKGQHPFDYICADAGGNKYLVDVTSASFDERPAELSKKEMQVANKAREKGFKILMPVVKFMRNWVLRVELAEE